MLLQPVFKQQLEAYADTLKRVFSNLGKAQPEDQLKNPIQTLFKDCGLVSYVIDSNSEVQIREIGGRPDLGIRTNQLLCGFIELKAPGIGVNPKKFDERSKKQFDKFKALPNLMYTDGLEWALYRSGEKVDSLNLGELTEQGQKGLDDKAAQKLQSLLTDFLQWEPFTPKSPQALAEFLAPLCRMVRDDVTVALQDPESALTAIAHDWRNTLFPDADDAQFADAYAQTLTYALLLARLSGATDLDPEVASRKLESGHGLLAGALKILGNETVSQDLGVGIKVLQRCITALDPQIMTQKNRREWSYKHDSNYPTASRQTGFDDPWFYFYEDFLGAYDRKLRNDYGVYYTPPPVILCQVKLVEELLKKHFNKPLGFAEEGVIVLDPATGTGTYPLAVLAQGLANVETQYGKGARSQTASQLAQNIHAFEFLVGPYAVAHLRITQKILEEGGQLPKDGAHVYLTDTLENPDLPPLQGVGLLYKRLSDEHKRAQKIKKDTEVLVCIGNPPYDRQERSEADIEQGVELKGGWIRFGGVDETGTKREGILKDFTEPAKLVGKGGHLRNLYNDYVYFWRWAIYKVFEQKPQPGIVSFITASSYLRGPGFVGMREHMRKVFDEIWIIDLEGDSLGARKTENVFAIRTPVAIALGVRYGKPNPNQSAKVHYTKITGTREEKLEQLSSVTGFVSLSWKACFSGWQDPIVPQDSGNYYELPNLTDLFPWQHSGAKLHRTWPIGETN